MGWLALSQGIKGALFEMDWHYRMIDYAGKIGLGISLLVLVVVAGGCAIKPTVEPLNERAVEKTPLSSKETPQPAPMPTNTDTPIPTYTSSPTHTSTSDGIAFPVAGATQPSAKDGMVSVFIPPGEFLMGSGDSDTQAFSNEKPQHRVYLDAYWMDKSEVTNVMYKKCVEDGNCEKPGCSYYGDSQKNDHPVVCVDWSQAQKYCQWVGGKLPSEAEWEKAARGTDGRKYPWGDRAPDSSLLNYNQNIKDTTEGGSYPKGMSPYGLLDMAGNVWEWVNDWYGENYYRNSPHKNPTGPDSGQYRVLRGGSWYVASWRVRVANRFRVGANYRNDFVGFRCMRLSVISPPDAQTPFPLPTLTSNAARYPAAGATRISNKDGMEQVYVSSGEFLMGSLEGEQDEKPQHRVSLDGYWIDKSEVTNNMYKKCVQDGVCQEPNVTDHYENPTYADHPVVYVDWAMARAYCAWAGGRLPSEAEWEKAARGTDGRKYPWGNADPDFERANYTNHIKDTTAVGKYSRGASPYGVLDMGGNVWEWVNDWYAENYYQTSPLRNPMGAKNGQVRVIRGGSWDRYSGFMRTANRDGDGQDGRDNNLGFRCTRMEL